MFLNLSFRLFCVYEDVGDSTDLDLSNVTGRPSTIICNSSDFHESGTHEKSSSDDSNGSDSDSSSSMESQPLGKHK